MNVDPDELAARRHCHGQGRDGVVAQHIDAHGDGHGAAHVLNRQGHGGHCFRLHAARAEGGIAEVLDDDAVGALVLEIARLHPGPVQDGLEVAVPPGRAGQGQQMHHADEYLAIAKKFPRHYLACQSKDLRFPNLEVKNLPQCVFNPHQVST